MFQAASRPACLACGLLMVICLPAPASAQEPAGSSQITLPDTYAARLLDGFLTAFNTGRRSEIRAFLAANFDGPPNDPSFVDSLTDTQMRSYSQTHGFRIRKVESSAAAAVRVLVQAYSTGAWEEMSIYVTAKAPEYVEPAAPYHIVGLGFSDTNTPVDVLTHQRVSVSEIRRRLDKVLTTLYADDGFSGVVVVAKNGKRIYGRAVGYANRVDRVPIRLDTRFNLASITKMFTAVAVAQLVEQGKLSYSQTVGSVLKDYPNSEVAGKVTIRHLLSHTSGLIGGRALVEKSSPNPKLRTIAEMVKSFANEPLSFQPGQQFDYSNAGFELLGAIIEQASGQTYYNYVRDHVFKPAGMTQTDFLELDHDPLNVAAGYEDAPNSLRLNNIFDLGVIGSPAGGAYSTGDDMVKFQVALLNGALISKQSLNTLWTGVTENPQTHREYGYGAEIERYNGTTIVGHGGGWQGITNTFEMYPDLEYTVVVLSNIDDDPNSIANRLREWLTDGVTNPDHEPAGSPAITVSVKVSSDSVPLGSPATVTLTVKNTGATAHASTVDMEIKDEHGAKADQQFTMGQKLTAGDHSYSYTWTPKARGSYTVDVGVFGPGWQTKYLFDGAVARITVN